MVYISPTESGSITDVRPTPPYYDFSVGEVTKADAATGKLLVKMGTIRDFFTKTVRVEPSGGDFNSISGAIAAIDNPNSLNRYNVIVGPGIYYEDNPIQLKQYVNVIGEGGFTSTVVEANDTGSDVFLLTSRCGLEGFQIGSETGMSGSTAGVKFVEPGACPISNIIFENCDVGIELDNANAYLDAKNMFAFTSVATMSAMVHVKNGELDIQHSKILLDSHVDKAIFVEGTGSIVFGNLLLSTSKNLNHGIYAISGSNVVYTDVNFLPQQPSTNRPCGICADGKVGFIPTRVSIDGVNIAYAQRALCSNGGAAMTVTSTKLAWNDIAIQVENSGSGTQVTTNAVTVVGSNVWDLNVKSATGKVFGSGNSFDSTKLSLEQGSSVYVSFVSDVTDDEGMNVLGELHVGSPEFPAETVMGEGDSYTRGMLIYTYESSSDTWKDVTVSGSTPSDGLSIGFPGTASGDCIYLATTLQQSEDYIKYFGLKLAVTQSINTGSGYALSEYYNGSEWVPFNFMLTQAGGEFLPLGRTLGGQTGSYHLRFDWRMNSNWSVSDDMGYGTDLFWARYRIIQPISQSILFDQIKIHSNRSEINGDGFLEYFGRARPYGTLPWDANLVKPGASAPVDQNVFLSDDLDVGRTENKFANTATDRIGFNSYLPEDLDTSCPVQLKWTIITDDNSGGNIDWNIRWGYSTDGDPVYLGQGSAPTTASNEQTMSISVAAPLQEISKTYTANLNIPDMVSRRESGSEGDMLWMTLERPVGDSHGGDVTLVNLTGKYTKWCEGGHQFL